MPVNAGRHNFTFMYNSCYAPWEHYPKNLSHTEIMEPLKVVDDFFSCDSPTGHSERLKEWRYYAINDKVFKDKQQGIGSLLFDYDLNLKLLEAVHLLYFNYKNYSYRWKEVPEEQLNLEKEKWGDSIDNLSKKEWLNPYKAVKKIFEKIGPQHYRDCLHDWLHSAFYKRADLDGINAHGVVTVYENMLRLYSAAWLILKREKAKSKIEPQPEEVQIAEQPLNEIRTINPNPTPAERLGLDELKNLIVERVPAVQMIIYLGTHKPSQLFYLLVLISDDEKTTEHEVSNKIEDNCQYLAKVHTIVHKSNSAKEALNIGRRFWATVMEKGLVVYQSSALVLPAHREITNEILLERAKFNWERWGVQGKEFLKGAERYKADKNYQLTAFLLHQAVESSLKATIQAIIGYRVQMHNLSRLIRLTLLFTDDLKNVFELDTIEGAQIFTLLQNAYSQSRYNSAFDPDAASIEILTHRVKEFCNVAERIYHQFLEKY